MKNRLTTCPCLGMLLSAMLVLVVPAPAAAGHPFETLQVAVPPIRVEAPDFSLPGLDAHPLRLSDCRGKLVLLNFWATFCAPCREEMSALESLWRRYRGDGLVVLAVAVDRGGPRVVADYVRESGLSYPVLLDPGGRARRAYEVTVLPMTYLIGPDGRILGRALGARDWAGPEGRDLIAHLLADGSSHGP